MHIRKQMIKHWTGVYLSFKNYIIEDKKTEIQRMERSSEGFEEGK